MVDTCIEFAENELSFTQTHQRYISNCIIQVAELFCAKQFPHTQLMWLKISYLQSIKITRFYARVKPRRVQQSHAIFLLNLALLLLLLLHLEH